MFDCRLQYKYITSQPAWLVSERVEGQEGMPYAPSEEGGEDGRRLWPSSQFQLASIPLKKENNANLHKRKKSKLPSKSLPFHWIKMNSYGCLKWQRQDVSANFHTAEWFDVWRAIMCMYYIEREPQWFGHFCRGRAIWIWWGQHQWPKQRRVHHPKSIRR